MSTPRQVLSLPLAEPEKPAAEWQGLVPIALPDPELASAIPLEPQGEYAPENGVEPELILNPTVAPDRPVELLAPAGGPEAAFAALQYGADAIYLGLKKFSARAEAENFTLEELAEVTAYAHSLEPRRRVFVTINTVVRQDELAELAADVLGLAEIGVDAVILQDLGVYRLLREHFPKLELHASTQLAVHNRAGAEALRQLGFHRVVLARELTFEEVRDITQTAGIETEVFIHGALCYSYSGLCLFSSQTLGRSGNRGKCAYSCRDAFSVEGAPATLRDGRPTKRDPSEGFPFSMKDLALPDHLPALRSAGVSCFKIEGRKKSPLYVATTTDYYRGLLDGTLKPEARPSHEADMQTVFSRPWTRLFVQSYRDKEVADRDTVGHRGALIGHVEKVRDGRLRFRAGRALERHDGLQIDLPTLGKPFGFPIDHLFVIEKQHKVREVFESPAGSLVEVKLPAEHPQIPTGAPVYCSSSQAVKRRYRHERPKQSLYMHRSRLEVHLELTPDVLIVHGRLLDHPQVEARVHLPGPFESAREAAAMEGAARSAFSKLGDTAFELGSLRFDNPSNFFVPVSRLNQIRRDLIAELTRRLEADRRGRLEAVASAIEPPASSAAPAERFRWSLKVDRLKFLDDLEPSDWADLDELVIDIARDSLPALQEGLARWSDRVGRGRIRLSLPAVTRGWEEKPLTRKIASLRADGWRAWEVSNLSGWSFLHADPLRPNGELDLATDWSIYVLNRLAAQQLLDMGVSRFALSPEDGLTNIRSLLGEFAAQAVVIVYQDTPLFLAESCAYANLIGGCPGKANCKFESMEMVSTHGERVTALDYHCRTIVLNQGPYCLSTRLKDLRKAGARLLRADFVYRQYEPTEVRERWRLVRAGRAVPGGHWANFDRGME